MKKVFLLVAFCHLTILQVVASSIWANQWNVLKFHAYFGLDKEDAVIYEFTQSADTIINDVIILR